MAASRPLFLHEEILLLALHDQRGTIINENYNYAMAGAALAELLLSHRIGLAPQGRKQLVTLVSDQPLGDPVLDECLEKVATAKRPGTLESWVERFTAIGQLHHRVAQQLCRRGILRADEDKVLLIFTRRTYPEIDHEPEQEIIARLHAAIFTDTTDIDPRTVALVSLAQQSGLLRTLFGKQELKAREVRLKQLTSGELTGQATKAAIEAMQAAIMAAVIMPMMFSTFHS